MLREVNFPCFPAPNAQPRQKYGSGNEARKARALLQSPAIAAYENSIESTHPANIYLRQIIGVHNMNMRSMHQFVLLLPKWFTNEVPRCDRNAFRRWSGCMWYLMTNQEYLKEARLQGLYDPSRCIVDDRQSGSSASETDPLSDPVSSPIEMRQSLPPIGELLKLVPDVILTGFHL
jgi:hypothetical protein